MLSSSLASSRPNTRMVLLQRWSCMDLKILPAYPLGILFMWFIWFVSTIIYGHVWWIALNYGPCLGRAESWMTNNSIDPWIVSQLIKSSRIQAQLPFPVIALVTADLSRPLWPTCSGTLVVCRPTSGIIYVWQRLLKPEQWWRHGSTNGINTHA